MASVQQITEKIEEVTIEEPPKEKKMYFQFGSDARHPFFHGEKRQGTSLCHPGHVFKGSL